MISKTSNEQSAPAQATAGLAPARQLIDEHIARAAALQAVMLLMRAGWRL